MAEEGLIIKIAANAKEFVTGADKAVKDVKSKFKGLGDEISKELKRVHTVGTTAFKGITGTIGAVAIGATAAVSSLVKASNDAFADYEQLEGGIKKLFGDGADELMAYAQKAYKTAGMSANEYMQNVTGFSAALINSLGGDTEKAAEIANMAMKDISDNANTFGKYSAQELAQVYQALAKGTFTTLDNLNLGFGGTKEGMEALIRHAETLDDSFKVVHTTAKNGNDEITYSFADMVQAIHIVQKDMKIMDTTEKEAATTISGSLNMVKASWQDVLVSISGGGKDLKKSISELVESIGYYAKNILPVIKEALNGIGTLIIELAPVIIDAIPELINTILPELLENISTLSDSISGAFEKLIPAVISVITQALPQVIDLGVKIVNSILTGIKTNISDIKTSASELMQEFFQGIRDIMPNLLSIAKDLIGVIAEGFIEYQALVMEIGIQIITTLAQGLADASPTLAPRVVELVTMLAQMLVENMPLLLESAITIITNIVNSIVEKLPELLGKITTLVYELGNKLFSTIDKWGPAILKILASIIAAVLAAIGALLISLIQNLGKWWNSSLKPWFDNLGNNIKDKVTNIKTKVTEIVENIKTAVKTKVDDIKTNVQTKVDEIKTKVSDIVAKIKTTVSDKVTDIKTKVTDTVSNLKQSISDKVNAIKESINNFLSNLKETVSEKVSNIADDFVGYWQNLPDRMLNIGRNIVEGLWNGIGGAASWLQEKVTGFVGSITGWFTGLFEEHSPSKVFERIGAYLTEGLAVGMEDESGMLKATAVDQMKQLKGVYDGMNLGAPKLSIAEGMSALSRMGQSIQSVTNENGNVFNFTNYFTGSGTEAGDELFRQFQRRVRYSGGVL